MSISGADACHGYAKTPRSREYMCDIANRHLKRLLAKYSITNKSDIERIQDIYDESYFESLRNRIVRLSSLQEADLDYHCRSNSNCRIRILLRTEPAWGAHLFLSTIAPLCYLTYLPPEYLGEVNLGNLMDKVRLSQVPKPETPGEVLKAGEEILDQVAAAGLIALSELVFEQKPEPAGLPFDTPEWTLGTYFFRSKSIY